MNMSNQPKYIKTFDIPSLFVGSAKARIQPILNTVYLAARDNVDQGTLVTGGLEEALYASLKLQVAQESNTTISSMGEADLHSLLFITVKIMSKYFNNNAVSISDQVDILLKSITVPK